nr:hypothetical protein [Solidesulfovibrio aerotolerans]
MEKKKRQYLGDKHHGQIGEMNPDIGAKDRKLEPQQQRQDKGGDATGQITQDHDQDFPVSVPAKAYSAIRVLH